MFPREQGTASSASIPIRPHLSFSWRQRPTRFSASHRLCQLAHSARALNAVALERRKCFESPRTSRDRAWRKRLRSLRQLGGTGDKLEAAIPAHDRGVTRHGRRGAACCADTSAPTKFWLRISAVLGLVIAKLRARLGGHQRGCYGGVVATHAVRRHGSCRADALWLRT
jgi:hypothetical protein